jgi:hypothetical protein
MEEGTCDAFKAFIILPELAGNTGSVMGKLTVLPVTTALQEKTAWFTTRT